MIQFDKWGIGRSSIGWAITFCMWGLTATSVWLWMTSYAGTGSVVDSSASVAHWPSESALAKSGNRSTLLLFLHPRCPCSAAVLQELDRILSHSGLSPSQQPNVILVTSVPSHPTADWFESATLTQAKSLPNTEVFWDVAGYECQRFAAAISGTVRLYHRDGRLLFSGGVTVARGHAGASAGGDALRASLLDPHACRSLPTPVFGCPLCIEADVSRAGGVRSLSSAALADARTSP